MATFSKAGLGCLIHGIVIHHKCKALTEERQQAALPMTHRTEYRSFSFNLLSYLKRVSFTYWAEERCALTAPRPTLFLPCQPPKSLLASSRYPQRYASVSTNASSHLPSQSQYNIIKRTHSTIDHVDLETITTRQTYPANSSDVTEQSLQKQSRSCSQKMSSLSHESVVIWQQSRDLHQSAATTCSFVTSAMRRCTCMRIGSRSCEY